MSGDYDDQIKCQILGAFGFSSEDELDPDGSYRAALAEYRAREEAYRAALPGRMEAAAAEVNERLRASGVLPPGCELTFAVVEGG